MQIPISEYSQPACIFEIGFQYTTWNGKENILNEKFVFGKETCFYFQK